MKKQICPVTAGLQTKINADGFSRACKAMQIMRNGTQPKAKLKHPHCSEICKGQVVPKEVVFQEVTEIIEPKEVASVMKTIEQPDFEQTGALKAIPGKEFSEISLVELKPYWINPIMIFRIPGTCPNCRREVKGHAAGVCAVCYSGSHKAKGTYLIETLEATRIRLEGRGVIREDTETQETSPDAIPESHPFIEHFPGKKAAPEPQNVETDEKTVDESIQKIQFDLIKTISKMPTAKRHTIDGWLARIDQGVRELNRAVMKL